MKKEIESVIAAEKNFYSAGTAENADSAYARSACMKTSGG